MYKYCESINMSNVERHTVFRAGKQVYSGHQYDKKKNRGCEHFQVETPKECEPKNELDRHPKIKWTYAAVKNLLYIF